MAVDGLSMLDVDRLRQWADKLETHTDDLQWSPVRNFVVSQLRDLATRVEAIAALAPPARNWPDFPDARPGRLDIAQPADRAAVAQCGAVHVAGKVHNTGTGAVCNVGTGAVCELPIGHTGNHRGQFKHGIAQWPDRAAAAPTPEGLEAMARRIADKTYTGGNLAFRETLYQDILDALRARPVMSDEVLRGMARIEAERVFFDVARYGTRDENPPENVDILAAMTDAAHCTARAVLARQEPPVPPHHLPCPCCGSSDWSCGH